MNGAIAPGSHAEKSPYKGEHDNARTHTHEHFHKPIHTFGFETHHTCKKKQKQSTNKDIFEQEQKKFLK